MPKKTLTLLWIGVLAASCSVVPKGKSLPPLPPRAEYALVGELGKETVERLDAVERLGAVEGLDAVRAAREKAEPAAEGAASAEEGALAVSVVRAGPRCALRLPYSAASDDAERIAWEWPTPMDLTRHKGVQFRFFSPDRRALSDLEVRLRSGKGVYVGEFSARTRGDWSVVQVSKIEMETEGSPAGWDAIEAIGVSARPRGERTGACYVADIGAWGAGEAPIALIWNASAVRADSGGPRQFSIGRFASWAARGMARSLDDLGLEYTVLSDEGLSAPLLEKAKLAVLPLCPDLERGAVDALTDFVKQGGKIVSFYYLPDSLVSVLGFEAGEEVGGFPGRGGQDSGRRGGQRRGEFRRQFASIHASGDVLRGLPEVVQEGAWRVLPVRPVEGRSRIAAYWHNEDGESTGHPAIVVSDNCVHMTFVVRERDSVEARLVLLAMLGHFAPECWEIAARRSLDRAGAFGGYESYAEAEAAIRRELTGDGKQALEGLEKAGVLRREAAGFTEAGKYAEAIAAAEQVSKEMGEAYCLAQTPKPGEHRAVWCHSAFGVRGRTWDEAIKNLADNGFTAILPNMCWGGIAYYDSKVLPVYDEIGTRGDQIEQCVAACRKYGVQCHVWKVNWNTGGGTPDDFIDKIEREGRVQIFYDGTTGENVWLCPSHPENQKLEIDAMVEIAEKYDVDGVHFDYIRYPGEVGETCFCAGCKERFEKFIGAKIEKWPDIVHDDPEVEQQWYEFRRQQITKVVATVAERVRAIKPNVKISAAVFRDWPSDRDRIGQDWKVWCDKGYLDFVCPMDYTPDNDVFEEMLSRQLPWVGDVPCYPGIGMGVWPDPDDITKLVEQIKLTRSLGADGFTIFNYEGESAVDRMIPMCGKGITRKE